MNSESSATMTLALRKAAIALGELADVIDQRRGAPPPLSPAPQPPSPAPAPAASGAVARFGRHKDAPLRDLPTPDLRWYADQLVKSVADPEKARWRQSNEADLAAARAELAHR
jgi:hypothetical protein